MKLRPYQLDALEAIKTKFEAGKRRLLVVMATGIGKTVVFSNLPQLIPNKRMLVLVHREELAQQAADKIKKWNPELSVAIEMGYLRDDNNSQIVVGSVPTLSRANSTRLQALKPEDFGIIVTDEAHHATADSYQTIYQYFGVLADTSHILHVGVTATPNRADGKGLAEVFSEVTYQMGILDAIKQGWLVNLRGYKITTDQSLDGVHTRAGDFATDELANAVNNAQRNELVVKHWLEKAQGRTTLVFCVDIAHAQAMAQTFKSYNISAEAVWGDDPKRSEKLDELRNGKLVVICNCAVLTEGFDAWQISAIVMARPTKSQLLYVQCTGRGTRIPDGINNLLEARADNTPIQKEDCILLDVVDATTKHSLITVPKLFGMSERMDMQGRTVTTALDYFNKVQEEHPNADLKNAQDLLKLRSYAVSVDLFSFKWAEEILGASKLQWHKSTDGHYMLYLKSGRLNVYEDLVQKWHVSGQLGEKINHVDEHNINDLPEALRIAEEFVRLLCPEEMTLVRREARWHKDVASEAQIRLLRRFRIPIPEGLTKGAAQIALNKVLRKR
jgi:superfamily II DNA or RNA helicase